MSDVQVTQEDREAASQFWADTACLYGTQDKLLAEAFARHRLATRPAPVGEPVAWMYAHPKFGCYTDIKRRFTHPGWTETPLYTRPALDVDGLVDILRNTIAFAMAPRINAASHRLTVQPAA